MMMIRLRVAAMLLPMLSSSVPPAYSRVEPHPPPQRGPILSGSFASGAKRVGQGEKFVLVSWNIERGVRRSEILEALRGPLAADIYLLQEVDLNTRRTGYQNVAEDLARELGMNYVFGTEFQELAQGRSGQPAFHGQAVLSRFPLSQARVLRFRHQLHNWRHGWLPRWGWVQPRLGGRIALVVELQLGGRTWVIYNAHLESKANDTGRARQIREILEDIDKHYTRDTPVIVAGDLNTQRGEGSPVVQELAASGFQCALEGRTEPLRTKVGSNRRPDWIFVRGPSPLGADVPKLRISDHYPLVARIALP